MRLLHFASATVLLAALGGCVSNEPAAYSEPPAVQSMTLRPQQRSYLDAGPAPARQGGPNYVRENAYGSPDAGTLLGRDSLPR